MKKFIDYMRNWADRTPYGKSLLALLNFLATWTLFRFEVAILIFGGLVIHECGHARAAHLRSVPCKGIYLFPWLGGLCVYGTKIRDWRVGTFLIVMGPYYSLLFSAALLSLGTMTENVFLLMGACTGAYVNVTDLMPVGIRDGQRLLRAIVTPSKISGLSQHERGKLLVSYVGMILLSALILYSSFDASFLLEPEKFYQTYLSRGIEFLVLSRIH